MELAGPLGTLLGSAQWKRASSRGEAGTSGFLSDSDSVLRCAGKAGNPFQTTQGNRLSCRDQEGRRGSEEAVPGPLLFPSGDPGMSGGVRNGEEA